MSPITVFDADIAAIVVCTTAVLLCAATALQILADGPPGAHRHPRPALALPAAPERVVAIAQVPYPLESRCRTRAIEALVRDEWGQR